MRPTEELMHEHKAIRLMLEILESSARQLESGKDVPADDLRQMVEFLRTFADGCHHAKEEEILFPALEQAGIPREHGPIGVMLAEHALGRNHIKSMNDALTAYAAGKTEAGRDFARAARAYSILLNQHIEKENVILFPMADARLPGATQDALSVAFEQIENERVGKGTHEAFHAMLRELASRYLIGEPKENHAG